MDMSEAASRQYCGIEVLEGTRKNILRKEGHWRGELMRIVRYTGLITLVSLLCVATLVLLLHHTPSVSAQTGPPPSSSISSSSGPVAWDFAAVGGGTVTNVGIQDIFPPVICDDTHLTVVFPAPAPTSSQAI